MTTYHIADDLARKYRIALAVVALLVLGDAWLIQPYVILLTEGAPRINVAGRQRMLSQRLAKAALALELEPGEQGKTRVAEIREVLGLWSGAHERLLLGDGRIPGTDDDARRGLELLTPCFRRMEAGARTSIQAAEADPPDLAGIREGVAVILANEAEYLTRMEGVVGLYEREARGRVETLRRISWTVTGLTLAGLAAIGLLILRPAVRVIRRQISELARARDVLETRVAERTQELELAQERQRVLQEQLSHVGRTRALGEMASALGHEIKQPLGAIANYAEGCLVELAGERPAIQEVRGALEKLLAATLRAGRIIERIRQFVTRHEPRREPFDPNQVVAEAEEILRHEANRRAVAVRFELAPDLPLLHGDPIQIQQVLVNLLSNALEAIAAAEPPSPSLLIETKGTARGGVEFIVTDNGEGIEPDRINKVFDTYYSTRAEGMGMGLAISRSIVEAHQGRLTVTSLPGIQTTFRFTIPADGGIEHDRPHGLHR